MATRLLREGVPLSEVTERIAPYLGQAGLIDTPPSADQRAYVERLVPLIHERLEELSEAPELLDYCLSRGYALRFIEQMPLDAQHGWDRSLMVTADEILERLTARHSLTPLPGRGSAPAETFLVDGGPHTVGVIGSVTRPVCISSRPW